MNDIVVSSHVGRDLLQSAQVFKRDASVIWEYVANSLQYHDPAVSPRIAVTLNDRAKRITISDNGSGMSAEDLGHYFTMHGENRERRRGQYGRGRWGTGKSAAFGIANNLTITTVKEGTRNKVRLTREMAEGPEAGSHIPLERLEAEIATSEPNGTIVEIDQVQLKRIDREAVIRLIERMLVTFPRDAEVYVDGHQCVVRQPETVEEREFPAEGEFKRDLGQTKLVLRVARTPLDEESQGVQVYSHDNWMDTTLAGSEGREMSEYIFGAIEVPALEEYAGPIAPYDMTRSGLNGNNPVVQSLMRFIGPRIDALRRELVQRKREEARTAEARRLQEQADEISRLLTEDFAEQQAQLRRARFAARGAAQGTGSYGSDGGGEPTDDMVEGGDIAASRRTPETEKSDGSPSVSGRRGPDLPAPVDRNEQGETTGAPRGDEPGRSVPRGGFSVTYEHHGIDEPRARQFREGRRIEINLDHPQLSSLYSSDTDPTASPLFVRMSWEIAIQQYAITMAYELDDIGYFPVTQDALYEVLERTDRLARKLASPA